jgi:hypothetical protein
MLTRRTGAGRDAVEQKGCLVMEPKLGSVITGMDDHSMAEDVRRWRQRRGRLLSLCGLNFCLSACLEGYQIVA